MWHAAGRCPGLSKGKCKLRRNRNKIEDIGEKKQVCRFGERKAAMFLRPDDMNKNNM